MNRGLLAIVVLLLFGEHASAQLRKGGRDEFKEAVKRVEASFEPASAKPGDVVTWKLSVDMANGWHTYPTQQPDPKASEISEISLPKVRGLVPEGEIQESGERKTMPNPVGGLDLVFLEGTAVWEQKFKVTDEAANGMLSFDVPIRLTVCNDHSCLPPKKLTVTAKLDVSGAKGPASAINGTVTPPAITETVSSELPADTALYQAVMTELLNRIEKAAAPRHEGIGGFLLTAMFWGGVSLLTPCVFPMIPITVSFFLKQSDKNNANPMILALVYCATIIVVLGVASLTLLSFFTALSVNPWMNLFLGSLFVVMALSLFGMFDLTLPSFLTRFTASREGQGGIIGTIFMALTFTLVSFTCVAPFLGGFGGMASSGQFSWPVLLLGALTFAATFAAPFFLLALFPSLIRKLPKSGGWLHTVKVVMGFLELAAGLKFLRAAELIQFGSPSFFTYDLVLGAWVALSLLCGLYLIKVVRIGDDEAETGVAVPRFLFGAAFLGLAIYLTPGLFAGGPDGGNQRPRGTVFAWIDSFLLPDPTEGTGELQWTGDLKRAVDDARTERQSTNKPSYVFIDFTGETCTNCKLNEREIFTKPEVRELFKKYRLVQLYTDKVPDKFYSSKARSTFSGTARQQADAEVNGWFETQAFGTRQLPLYVILEPKPDGSIAVVRSYDEGKINRLSDFVEFLKSPFDKS